MTEFDIIAEFFAPLSALPGEADVRLGIGDDAAILKARPGRDLCIATDTLLAGRHFPEDLAPADIGYRALAVNVSDLAAMGASPRSFQLALTLPDTDPRWLTAFATGLANAAEDHGIRLTGGDLTRGPLTLSLTVLGDVPEGEGLTRAGARVGDTLWVSGIPGSAAVGLKLATGETMRMNPTLRLACESRFRRPLARVALGEALLPLASAAIDVSDGLLQDIGHIAQASAVGMVLETGALPELAVPARLNPLELALAGGDDYELAFTAPAAATAEIKVLASTLAVPLTAIGQVVEGHEVEVRGASGKRLRTLPEGYQHFR